MRLKSNFQFRDKRNILKGTASSQHKKNWLLFVGISGSDIVSMAADWWNLMINNYDHQWCIIASKWTIHLLLLLSTTTTKATMKAYVPMILVCLLCRQSNCSLYFWRTHQLGIHANADIFRIQCAAVAQENKDKKCGVKLFCQLRMGSLMLVAAIRSCWTTTTYLKFETFGSRNALNVRLYNYKITHIRSELPDRQQYAEATKRFCWGAERDTGRRRC